MNQSYFKNEEEQKMAKNKVKEVINIDELEVIEEVITEAEENEAEAVNPKDVI